MAAEQEFVHNGVRGFFAVFFGLVLGFIGLVSQGATEQIYAWTAVTETRYSERRRTRLRGGDRLIREFTVLAGPEVAPRVTTEMKGFPDRTPADRVCRMSAVIRRSK